MDSATAKQVWDERYSARDYVWTITVNRFVEEQLAGQAPGTAIDLAAGEGRNSVWLADRGWEVTAVDFSPIGLEKGRRLAAEHDVRVDFMEGDALVWEPEAKVDLVLLAYLQLDGPSRRSILARAATWLNPGGIVFVIAHDASNVEQGHGGPSSTAVCYDVDETVAALEGLEIETASVVERTVETEEGEQTALDTLVLARSPA